MGKRTKALAAKVAGAITTTATLLAALLTLTSDAAATLAASTFGSMYRTVSGGHVNKRGLFIAAIVDTVNGDGTFDTLRARMRFYAVPALRAEAAYAIASGDAAYFRDRKGAWCGWARPLLKGDALDPDAGDDAYANAFYATCPTNPANVGGMLAEVTLAAVRRNVTPLPVFADTVKYGKVTAYDADTHGADGYQSRGYGHATFTLAPVK